MVSILRSVVVLLLCWAFAAPQYAWAWGSDGHRLIAQLAYARLSPSARAEIDRLVSTDAAAPSPGCPITSIESASTWSDCVRAIRSYANQSPWHYDNIPVCETAPPFDCADGNCATAAIGRAERTLANRRATDQQRVRALARLVHFVGDIHQPLHAADNGDRGGNDDRVIYLREANFRTDSGQSRPNNLHGVWDTPLLITALAGDGRADVERQVAAFAGAWAQSDARDWAGESHRIAVEFIYARWPEPLRCGQRASVSVVIDEGYVADATPIIREQIAKASVRLSMVLERALR
jgi:hypothetical protein